jgi:DNA-binding response OmpR family regulator
MNSKKILIIDDDPDIVAFISLYLKDNGFEVFSALNDDTALNIAANIKPDIIILDVMLGKTSGFSLCEKIRTYTNSPVIFLSCLSDEEDKIKGFLSGGDDYITKPFSPRELYYRIQAILRRNISVNLTDEKSYSSIEFPNLKIDLQNNEVFSNEIKLNLTKKEFDLLVNLAKEPNHVFTSEELYFNIWRVPSHGDTRTVYVHINNLRKKINRYSNNNYIENIKGIGYRFLHK